MSNDQPHLTITLTGARPARIVKTDWPIVAKASGDSYSGNDYGRHQQAQAQGEVDEYRLVVRQHADGRAIVYAIVDAAISAWHAPAGGEDYRGGELLDAGAAADLVAAIQRVGHEAVAHALPERLVRECIADLPAVEI